MVTMRAVVYDHFRQLPEIRELPIPTPSPAGVVLQVEATGLCRSDWHAWQGHDDGIRLAHVPGHELVGHITAVGRDVHRFDVGERVTVPFVCACGHCPECEAGAGQVCRNQTQPGFTHHGSFADFVAIHHADVNLIPVPDELDAGAAALLGCRFATSYRGLAHRAKLQNGEWLVVFGCGGVGLSAVMIGAAIGARIIAVDINDTALATARTLGAQYTINAQQSDDTVARIRALTEDGAHVTVDALGREDTVNDAIRSLRPTGRHVQIGLFAEDPRVPFSAVVAGELQILGSHGMRAADYGALLELVLAGKLRPDQLVARTISLADTPRAMAVMPDTRGVTVIKPGLPPVS